MTKFTNRFSDDPFGVTTFKPEQWFPGTVAAKPPSALTSGGAAAAGGIPVAPAPMQSTGVAPAETPNDHALLNYAHHGVPTTVASHAAPVTSAAAQPSLLGVAKPKVTQATTPPVAEPQTAAGAPLAVPAPSEWQPPAPEAPANPADLIAGEMKLSLLRNMFPQHSITAVEYDPWKVLPTGLGTKVNVNEGVA